MGIQFKGTPPGIGRGGEWGQVENTPHGAKNNGEGLGFPWGLGIGAAVLGLGEGAWVGGEGGQEKAVGRR